LPKQSGILPEPKVETPTFVSKFKHNDTVIVKGTNKVGTVKTNLDNELVLVDFPKGPMGMHQSRLELYQPEQEKEFVFESIFDLGLSKIAKKKKDWDPNPWAVCHTTVDKDDEPAKYERCVKKVKKKQASGEREDKTPGGLADNNKPSDFDSKALDKGTKIEMEHTDDKDLAEEIAMDHLKEHKNYYELLPKMEKELEEKEAKSSTTHFDLIKDY